MDQIKVVVNGALGKVGREVVKGVCTEPGMELTGAVELEVTQDVLGLADGSGTVPFSCDLNYIINSTKPDVLVDFTTAKAAMAAARMAAEKKVNLVIGTTGLGANEINEIDCLVKENQIGAVIAPNFTIGAALMVHLARIAAKYFDSAEIIELHHNQKIDSPSGTALATARAMAEARDKPFNLSAQQRQPADSRGKLVEDIPIHSVRLPGLAAHQEVLLGTQGQILSIRHDTINRECYIPGVILAIKKVVKRKGLVIGLDTLLGL